MKAFRCLIVGLLIFLSGCSYAGQGALTPPAATVQTVENDPIISATPTFNPPAYTPGRFPDCQPASNVRPYSMKLQQPGSASTPAITSLRKLASNRGFFIGAAVAPAFLKDPAYSSLLAGEFNMVTPETAMKWEIIHPQPDHYDFTSGDQLVDFARQHDMSVRGHVLVWDLQMPPWVTEATLTRSEWVQILCTHIKTVVGHYRGAVYAWDVVNEAVNDDGSLRNTFWMERIGPDYIAMAFQWAREADPGARLFYNDNGGEGLNAKSQAIYVLVQEMIRQSIPIDGVGLQMHTDLYHAPTPLHLSENIQRLTELGLEVHITEMDVRLQNSEEPEPARLASQAEVYRQVVSTCLASPGCKAFVTWGLTDRYSWIPDWTGIPDAPLLFDLTGQPKPAYHAVREALLGK